MSEIKTLNKRKKYAISNKEIMLYFLKNHSDSKPTRDTAKFSLNYFFDDDSYGYSKHVFELRNKDFKDYFNFLKQKKNIALSSKQLRFSHFRVFINHIFNQYNTQFELERKIDMYFLLNDKTAFKWGNKGHKKPMTNKRVIATEEEIEKILNYMKLKNHRQYLMFRILVESGLRKGEMRTIKIEREDQNQDGLKILIPLEIDLKNRKLVGIGKTGEKHYPISQNLSNKLLRYLIDRKKKKTIAKELFLSNYRRAYGPSFSFLNKYLRNACTELGIIKRLSPHSFRRTINTLRIEKQECPPDIAKRLLNHKTGNSGDVNIDSYTMREWDKTIKYYDHYSPYKYLDL